MTPGPHIPLNITTSTPPGSLYQTFYFFDSHLSVTPRLVTKFLVSAPGSAGMDQAMIGVTLSQINHAQIDEVAGQMINKRGRRRGAVVSQWQDLQYD